MKTFRERQHGPGRAEQSRRQQDENGEEHRRQRRLDASCQRLVAEEQGREQSLRQNGVREDHILRDRHQDDEQEDRQEHDRRAGPDESFGRPLPDAGQDRQDGETALRQEAVRVFDGRIFFILQHPFGNCTGHVLTSFVFLEKTASDRGRKLLSFKRVCAFRSGLLPVRNRFWTSCPLR